MTLLASLRLNQTSRVILCIPLALHLYRMAKWLPSTSALLPCMHRIQLPAHAIERTHRAGLWLTLPRTKAVSSFISPLKPRCQDQDAHVNREDICPMHWRLHRLPDSMGGKSGQSCPGRPIVAFEKAVDAYVSRKDEM